MLSFIFRRHFDFHYAPMFITPPSRLRLFSSSFLRRFRHMLRYAIRFLRMAPFHFHDFASRRFIAIAVSVLPLLVISLFDYFYFVIFTPLIYAISRRR